MCINIIKNYAAFVIRRNVPPSIHPNQCDDVTRIINSTISLNRYASIYRNTQLRRCA